MASAPRYAVHLALADQPVLVVGGGVVALRRAMALAASGARVTVVAPAILEPFADLAVAIERRRYVPGEASSYRLVVAATNDEEVNRLVCADAAQANVWANNASAPDGGGFTLPAVVQRGRVLVSVGTDGASPALARWLRDQIADLLGPEVAVLAELIGEARTGARLDAPTDALPDWRPALDSGMLDLIRSGRIPEAKERLSACRSSSSG